MEYSWDRFSHRSRIRRKQLVKLIGDSKSGEDLIARIDVGSARITSTYGFSIDYPLADMLIDALVTYLNRKQRPRDLISESRRRMDEIFKSGSLKNAGLRERIELTLSGDLKSVEEPKDPHSRHRLRKAIRTVRRRYRESLKERGRHKMGGRPPEEHKATLARTLPLIYFRGTGKRPAYGYKNSKFRGRYIRFAHDALAFMGVVISDRYLVKYMLKMLPHIDKHRKGL